MQTCISLLFDKAVLEPTFCSIYADLCVSLSSALPEFPDPDDPTKPQTFRRVLLNTCQVEFEGAKELRREVKAMVDPAQVRRRTWGAGGGVGGGRGVVLVVGLGRLDRRCGRGELVLSCVAGWGGA